MIISVLNLDETGWLQNLPLQIGHAKDSGALSVLHINPSYDRQRLVAANGWGAHMHTSVLVVGSWLLTQPFDQLPWLEHVTAPSTDTH